MSRVVFPHHTGSVERRRWSAQPERAAVVVPPPPPPPTPRRTWLRHFCTRLYSHPQNDPYMLATEKNIYKKNKIQKKLPSKWLPGRKHLILVETGVESILVPPAWFLFSPFHPYKYGALIASIPSWSTVNVDYRNGIPLSQSARRNGWTWPMLGPEHETTPVLNERASFLRQRPMSGGRRPIDETNACSVATQRVDSYPSSQRWLPRCQYIACRICTQRAKPAKIRADQKNIYEWR